MNTLALYFHTLRHLRLQQVAARLWLRVSRPQPDLRAAPPPQHPVAIYQAPIALPPTQVGPETFRFLNTEGRCAVAMDWNPPDADKLWTYNLHYFDDLNAADAHRRAVWHERLLARWIAENPSGHGVGWEPYPLSRRIVNWVKWAARGEALSPECIASLAIQARWLMRRLEYHLLGNHLLMNAKALVHVGLFFNGVQPESWYERGRVILEREIREQVLGDGGHFERSTMYHASVLEDMLDLINIHRTYARAVPDDWYAATANMRRWLRTMIHPDGDIAFFNDSALDIAPSFAQLEAYAGRLSLPSLNEPQEGVRVLAASGYVRAALGPAYLICDCAAVGPDYLPGHAHADTLSFELSLFGARWLVNSGTSLYGGGAERQRQRATAAHNTVVVDGENSSEVWGGFRVARRARASLTRVTHGVPVVIEAQHDGYCRLPGRNVHIRRWLLAPASLEIEDRVTGSFSSAQAHFHLHPEVRPRLVDASIVQLSTEAGRSVQMNFAGASAVTIGAGTWHPRFGIALENHRIVVSFAGAGLVTRLEWS